MKHLSLPLISASLDDCLTGPDVVFVSRHLDECSECRGRAARLSRIEELLRLIVVHEPGIAWYNTSTLALAERLRNERAELAAEAPKNLTAALAAGPAGPVPGPIEPRAHAETGPPETAAEHGVSPAITPIRREVPVEAPRLELAATRQARPAASPTVSERTRGAHAERTARSRREANRRPQHWIGLVGGLIGGALAGGVAVGLILIPRSSSRSVTVPPPAANVSTVRPEFEPPAPLESEAPTPAPEVVSAPAAPSERMSDSTRPVPGELGSARTRRDSLEPAVGSRLGPASATPAPEPASAAPAESAVSPAPATSPRTTEVAGERWPLLCGVVRDEYGGPVVGARVLLADLDVGGRTDENGRFCVTAPAGPRTLSLIAAGFAPVRLVVVVGEGRPDLDLMLHPVP